MLLNGPYGSRLWGSELVTDLPFMFLFRLFVGRQWTSFVHERWLIRVAPASRTRRLYTQVSVTAGLAMTQWTLELMTQL
jgi:hypothetical protein